MQQLLIFIGEMSDGYDINELVDQLQDLANANSTVEAIQDVATPALQEAIRRSISQGGHLCERLGCTRCARFVQNRTVRAWLTALILVSLGLVIAWYYEVVIRQCKV